MANTKTRFTTKAPTVSDAVALTRKMFAAPVLLKPQMVEVTVLFYLSG